MIVIRGPLSLSCITEIRVWVNNHAHCHLWHVITHPWSHFNNGVTQAWLLKFDENNGCNYLFMPKSQLNHVNKCLPRQNDFCILSRDQSIGQLPDWVLQITLIYRYKAIFRSVLDRSVSTCIILYWRCKLKLLIIVYYNLNINLAYKLSWSGTSLVRRSGHFHWHVVTATYMVLPHNYWYLYWNIHLFHIMYSCGTCEYKGFFFRYSQI